MGDGFCVNSNEFYGNSKIMKILLTLTAIFSIITLNHAQVTDGIIIEEATETGLKVESAGMYGIDVQGSSAAGVFRGRVGVGTDSPQTNMHSHQATSDANYFKITNTSSGTGSSDGFDLGINSSGNALVMQKENLRLQFGTNNLERMTISDQGLVGIGTVSPDEKLHLHSSGSNESFYKATNGNTTQGIEMGIEENGDALIIHRDKNNLTFGTNNVIGMTLDEGGDLGIGVANPGARLHIKDQSLTQFHISVADDVQGDRDWGIETSSQSFQIKDLSQPVSFQSKISINAMSGDVGLGDPTPDADLDVTRNNTYSHLNAGDATFTVSSSRSLKEKIRRVQVENILEKVAAVQVQNYDWRKEVFSGEEDDRTNKIGLIAEDFHTILGRGNEKEINTNEVIMVLWMAVQELSIELERIKGRTN